MNEIPFQNKINPRIILKSINHFGWWEEVFFSIAVFNSMAQVLIL
jgi:hypothetical protein